MFQPVLGPSSSEAKTKYLKEDNIKMKKISLSLSLSLAYIKTLSIDVVASQVISLLVGWLVG